MLKSIWQWITRNTFNGRFHDFYADMTPEELQSLIDDNKTYAEELYKTATDEYWEAERERIRHMANIKAQRKALSNEYPFNREN